MREFVFRGGTKTVNIFGVNLFASARNPTIIAPSHFAAKRRGAAGLRR
jgi:hypothetical protein